MRRPPAALPEREPASSCSDGACLRLIDKPRRCKVRSPLGFHPGSGEVPMQVNDRNGSGLAVVMVALFATGCDRFTDETASAGAGDLKSLARESLAQLDGEVVLAGLQQPVEVVRAAHLRAERRRPLLRAGIRHGPGPALAVGDVAPVARGTACRNLRAGGLRL